LRYPGHPFTRVKLSCVIVRNSVFAVLFQ